MKTTHSNSAIKGSQKWMQFFVNEQTDYLNKQIQNTPDYNSRSKISWVSPLKQNDFEEYLDQKFIDKLSLSLSNRNLSSFWPKSGPRWDGLAKAEDGTVLLIEAKSHLAEVSSICRAGSKSKKHIQKSIKEAADFYGSQNPERWITDYYQYANRLAHLYFLREINHIPAWLLFIYFVNDIDMKGPSSKEEWLPTIKEIHKHLDVHEDRIKPYVIDLFIDVSKFTTST